MNLSEGFSVRRSMTVPETLMESMYDPVLNASTRLTAGFFSVMSVTPSKKLRL